MSLQTHTLCPWIDLWSCQLRRGSGDIWVVEGKVDMSQIIRDLQSITAVPLRRLSHASLFLRHPPPPTSQ